MQHTLERSKIIAHRWNSLYRIRTPVKYEKGGKWIETFTRSEAYVNSNGVVGILLDGVSGFYDLDDIKPIYGYFDRH